MNETKSGARVSNTRGTAAIAHWDVPDCGVCMSRTVFYLLSAACSPTLNELTDPQNTEFFINLQPNSHLDEAYGGYCVWAEVHPGDSSSFAVIDKVAAAVKGGKNTVINRIVVLP